MSDPELDRMKRELTENYRKAGIFEDSPQVRQKARHLLRLIPKSDPRDLTARICGDPIPGDPRRPWLRRHVR